MQVRETFVSITVSDMKRATAFYTAAFGATVSFASPAWSSLHIAGVRLGLFHRDPRTATPEAAAFGRTGIHLVVDDLAPANVEIGRAGGRVLGVPVEVAAGVWVLDVVDTEGNVLTMRAA